MKIGLLQVWEILLSGHTKSVASSVSGPARAAILPSTRLAPVPPAKALRLDFRGAPLGTVLNYLSDAADLTIRALSKVEVEPRIDLWSTEPVDPENALNLLDRALREQGYTAIHKGRLLTILSRQDSKKYCLPLPALA